MNIRKAQAEAVLEMNPETLDAKGREGMLRSIEYLLSPAGAMTGKIPRRMERKLKSVHQYVWVLDSQARQGGM